MARRALLLFVDGVGIGEADAAINPLMRAELPTIGKLLRGARPVMGSVPCATADATALGLDATFGIDGTPQSGTGQTALLTGHDAARRFGRHFGPWVPTELRDMLARESVLAKVRDAGGSVAFANAYPEELVAQLEPGAARLRRVPAFLRAAPPLAALGVGQLNRDTAALERGDAIASEITNDGWRRHLGRASLPRITAHAAGGNLARIVAAHDLTLFAHYSTDAAGHARDMDACVAALERVDAFLGGVLASLPVGSLVVVASDHGNIEDVRTGHTRNPALFMAIGAGHAELSAGLTSLLDVAPALLRWLAGAGERASTVG